VKRAIVILLVVVGVVAVGIRVLGASKANNVPGAVTHRGQEVIGFEARTPRSLRSIHFLTAPPVLDGDLSDWPAWDSIDVNRATAFSFSGLVGSTSDLSATVRSGWVADTLYFAIQVSDDVIVTDSADVWRDDGVEIGLDGLRDGQAWGGDDHQYTLVADGRVTDRGVVVTDVLAAAGRFPGGYTIEVGIPISKLIPGAPISGTVMAFTVGVHDDDDGGNWDAYLIWEGTSTSSSPALFGSLVFSERPEDRIAVLEAKVTQLEAKVQELLTVLSQFEKLTPP